MIFQTLTRSYRKDVFEEINDSIGIMILLFTSPFNNEAQYLQDEDIKDQTTSEAKLTKGYLFTNLQHIIHKA